ncbi:XAC0095 family protein [Pseudoxanthomonas sp. UC19_8]|uniref:XAC0095 family protein n=1 Tax=Pseudoxanthomonas sp. UC19_8 TaxID=3350175 RepID=UPI0036D2ACA1
MSYDRLDDEEGPGYFLPVEGQVRLARLSDHVRFLARLLAPRTQAEEDAAGRGVRMGEVAFCLELLADQVGQVLEALSWPAQGPGDAAEGLPDIDGDGATDAGCAAFRVTLAQLDRLNLLVETASAHARVVAVGDATGRVGHAPPEVGETLCAAVDEVRALLGQVERQPLRAALSARVREEQAIYAVGPAVQADERGWMH